MVWYGLAILVAASFHLRLIYEGKQSNKMSVEHGVVSEMLRACPDKPNCVNSQTKDDSEHFIEPFVYQKSIPETKEEILDYLKSHDFEVIEVTEDYIYATDTSEYYKFVDDIEFYFLEDVVHFRSSSRVGYSDLGANAKRIQSIKDYLSK
jgi:uncharacterized protein (DUF1499 family)